MHTEIEKFVKLVVPRNAFSGFDFLVKIVGEPREEVLAGIIPLESDVSYFEKRRDITNHLLGHPRFRASINPEALDRALEVMHGEKIAKELLQKYRFLSKTLLQDKHDCQ